MAEVPPPGLSAFQMRQWIAARTDSGGTCIKKDSDGLDATFKNRQTDVSGRSAKAADEVRYQPGDGAVGMAPAVGVGGSMFMFEEEDEDSRYDQSECESEDENEGEGEGEDDECDDDEGGDREVGGTRTKKRPREQGVYRVPASQTQSANSELDTLRCAFTFLDEDGGDKVQSMDEGSVAIRLKANESLALLGCCDVRVVCGAIKVMGLRLTSRQRLATALVSPCGGICLSIEHSPRREGDDGDDEQGADDMIDSVNEEYTGGLSRWVSKFADNESIVLLSKRLERSPDIVTLAAHAVPPLPFAVPVSDSFCTKTDFSQPPTTFPKKAHERRTRLSRTYIHTCTHMHIRTHTRARAHAYARTCIHVCKRTSLSITRFLFYQCAL